jgi:predicted RNA binding protein YcfA (HicA-like mRNA interferase family)
LKVKDVIKCIEADGWYLVRIRGDHRHFWHPVKPGTVTVASHLAKDMPAGTLNSVWKQAQLKKDKEHG